MPAAIATNAWKIRVRSSSRCSRKLIEGICSESVSGASSSAVESGIGGVVGGRSQVVGRAGLGSFLVLMACRRRGLFVPWFGGHVGLGGCGVYVSSVGQALV